MTDFCHAISILAAQGSVESNGISAEAAAGAVLSSIKKISPCRLAHWASVGQVGL
jgi:hypothetical protein